MTLEDRSGDAHDEYEVAEKFVVEPEAEWAIDPVKNRYVMTLQTCTSPGGENRIIVRADRVQAPGQLGGIRRSSR